MGVRGENGMDIGGVVGLCWVCCETFFDGVVGDADDVGDAMLVM